MWWVFHGRVKSRLLELIDASPEKVQKQNKLVLMEVLFKCKKTIYFHPV